ncbi:MAG: FG-GAP-like repeat-containing protein [Gemmatimonadota bacterium]
MGVGRSGARRCGLLGAALALTGACGGDVSPPQPTEWHEGEGYRWRELAVPEGGGPGFRALPASRTGIAFTNHVSREELLEDQILENGSGVAIEDVDGDGRPDIYLARLEGPNALYRNLGGWRFEDVGAAAGVAADDRFSTGATLADVDGDGDPDLVLTALGGPNGLFLNDGTGHFRDATETAGLTSDLGSTTAALADVDGDGDLDLYVANYKRKSVLDLFPPQERTFTKTVLRRGDSVVVAPAFREHYVLAWQGTELKRYELGEPDRFYLNDGTGTFREVPFTSGRFLGAAGTPLSREPRDWGLAARFQDLDGDGDPDLYVNNDLQSPDRLWWNEGGIFREASPLAARTTSASSMAVDFADVDLDGDVDIFTVDMLSRDPRRRKTQVPVLPLLPSLPGEIATVQQVPRNVLLVARGDGTYAEAAHYAGIAASEWSWSTLFLDVDLDGDEDLLIPNGNALDHMDADAQMRVQRAFLEDWREGRLLYEPLRTPNVAFRNEGGLRFTEVGQEWGFGTEADISHGIATGDLDGDGDLDVVSNRLESPALVLRNEATGPRIAVRLEGRPPNTRGVGATIRLGGGPAPVQRREIAAGGLYLSSSEPLATFAAPANDSLTLVVDWRSGGRSRVENARANRLYVIREPPSPGGSSPAGAGDRSATSPPAFREVPLDHLHLETAYDDFKRQPLLPLRLSQLGPGVAWQDVDADGDPDLVLASGRGGSLALFRNEPGGFQRVILRAPEAPLDETTVLGLPRQDGGVALLVGLLNYEAPDPRTAREAPSVLRIDLDPSGPASGELRAAVAAAVPGDASGTGPLALADYDEDGDLDLFVGGRVRPAAYPEPAAWRFFRNDGGAFFLDVENSRPLASAGLASAAVFSDVDGDGDPDLLVARDWGPLTLLLNEAGRFTDATQAWGLAAFTGRWNGLTTGDLNGDGRLDVIATAWGENTGLTATSAHPLRLYYGDFDADGTLDLVPAAYEEELGDYAPVAGFERLGRGLPYVRERLGSFEAYARATVATALGAAYSRTRIVEASHLAHFLFLNRGHGFEAVPLPPEAQLAPAFYAGVADFDGDGREDLFLAQNFFATDPETPRYDSGRGLWLRGDGRGGLEPVPGRRSGVRVYGDQRGAALGDFDADGRVDLVVSQNGEAAKLFRNETAAPGLRVRLVGPPANPDAVGAAVRVVYAGGRGPVREVKAGSGYWSQDDRVPVLGLREEPRAVWVRWPGGEETEQPVAPGAREVRIRAPGAGPGAGS